MIRKIEVRLNSAFPNVPLGPFHVFAGSSAMLEVASVPANVSSVKAVVYPPGAAEQTEIDGVAIGRMWAILAPGELLAVPGMRTRGIRIVGTDSDGNSYTLGAGDLAVMNAEGEYTPGTAGKRDKDDLKIYDAQGHVVQGDRLAKASESVCHADFDEIEMPDSPTLKQLTAFVGVLLEKMKGE